MNTATLLADPSAIKLTYIRSAADSITIVVKTILTHSPCPICGSRSTFVHSRYVRRIADLPWQGVSVNKKRDPASHPGKFMSDAATAYAVLALSHGTR